MSRLLLLGVGASKVKYDPNAFVVELDTTSQADRTVRIPFQGTMNVDIDWGDGNTDTGVTTANPEHTYADHGTYIVQVSGSAARLGNDAPHVRWTQTLVACHSFGSLGLTSLQSAFRDYPGTSLTVPKVLPSSVTSMANMFRDCSELTSLDVSGFDTANVTLMNIMFYGCSGLTALDVSGFDTAKVESMAYMFYGCSELTSLDVSGFDTAKVESMYAMFFDCSSLTSLDVSGFDTANVESMRAMFFGCSELTSLDVSGFDTANVESMWAMFRDCSGMSVDASTFNIAALTDATDMYLDSGHTTAHYDALLIAWGAQTVQSGVAFHAGSAKYTPGGAAEAGRDTLTGAPNLWTITDGGPVT